MPRLYEWESFLKPNEQHMMDRWGRLLEGAKKEVERLQTNRDTIRRKAVQRARNALNKRLRAEMKERAK